ncbi:hypothetical protein [Sphingomonas oligophenolica]|nr:hypothetical protein [Sphingomonas oligophenolica]
MTPRKRIRLGPAQAHPIARLPTAGTPPSFAAMIPTAAPVLPWPVG